MRTARSIRALTTEAIEPGPVRYSKRPVGPVIVFGHDAWRAFVGKLV